MATSQKCYKIDPTTYKDIIIYMIILQAWMKRKKNNVNLNLKYIKK